MANHSNSIVVAVDGSKEAEYAFRKASFWNGNQYIGKGSISQSMYDFRDSPTFCYIIIQ
ncbi:universal stress protein [Psychrobacillus sp. FSL H8-0483]|uniref:universal stress protein n=1 Tax=Psychrobacillus sp. FSL H8-0483 TaxID=2921389 RepID=UPI00315B3CC3